jgi:hypothetical protein
MNRRLRSSITLLCLAAASAWNSYAAGGAGVVDPQPFIDLAGSDEPLVEVYLSGPMLRTLSAGLIGEDPQSGKAVSALEAVTAVIVEVPPAKSDAARNLVRSTQTRLLGSGWSVLARVRDKGDHVTVLTKTTGTGTLFDGLVVMVLSSEQIWDSDSTTETKANVLQLIFANIAGPIRLSDIGRIGSALELPGIDQIPHQKGSDQ